MKKIISLLLALVLLATACFTLASCGAPEDDGAEIAVYLGNGIYDLDPTEYYVDSNAEQVMSLLFEPLFRYEDGKLKNGVAESYTVDRENREIVITLRETYWSNNTKVQGSDFVYAWSERLLSPNNANPAAALLYDIENALAIKSGVMSPAELKVEASGNTITITYREGADYEQLLINLASVATAPVRQATVDTTPTYWSKVTTTIMTNGPFKVNKYNVATSELVLARNDGYHQEFDVEDYDNIVTPGKLIGFTTALGETVEVSYADIENKTVFYMTDAPLVDRIANKGEAKVSDDTSVYTYVFNTEKPLFAIPEVRRALSMAIDRQAIVDAIAFGKAADGFVPDISGGSDADLISTDAKATEAADLLSTVNLAGIDRSFTLTVADDEESKAIANLVKAAWDALGFSVTVQPVTSKQFTVGTGDNAIGISDSYIQSTVKDIALAGADFDVIALDWQTYTTDAFVALASLTSSMNGCGRELPYGAARTSITGWVNADYDYYVTAAYKASGEERANMLAEAERILCEESPIVPIVFNQNFAFVSDELSKVDFDSFGNVVLTEAELKNYKDYLEE